jgi:hypothetical protein
MAVLVAGGLLMPARAHAGCDNQAFLRGDSAGQMTPGSMTHHVPGHPSPKPCSGPNCSRGSDPVPLVPVFLSPSTGDQWLWVPPFRVTGDDGKARFLGDQPTLQPIRRGDPIEHPPRLSHSRSF